MTLQNTKIQLRTDDLSNWTETDPVLLNGEIAIVNDAGEGIVRFKVGDGSTAFTQLKYVDQPKVITDLLEAAAVDVNYIQQGLYAKASPYGIAAGYHLSANGDFSQAMGVKSQVLSSDTYAFVWNGDDSTYSPYSNASYKSHGKGTFSINPVSGSLGLYIGDNSLSSMLSAYAMQQQLSSYLPLSGGVMEGDLNLGERKLVFSENSESHMFGDPVYGVWIQAEGGDGMELFQFGGMGGVQTDAQVARFMDLAGKADVSSLANYLPLSGGTMTGAFSAPTAQFGDGTASRDALTSWNAVGVMANTGNRMLGDDLQLLSDGIDLKQDKLTQEQISAVDSVVDERHTVFDFGSDRTSAFLLQPEATRQMMAEAGLVDSSTQAWLSSPVAVRFGTAVSSIGDGTMSGCTSLVGVSFPWTLSRIGASAFYGCTSLSSAYAPSLVEYIGDSAFGNCSALQLAVIGAGTHEVNDAALAYEDVLMQRVDECVDKKIASAVSATYTYTEEELNA